MRSKPALTAEQELRKIPNVGPRIAGDLVRLGIGRADDLVDRDPDRMYDELCRIDGRRHDPCVRDVFAAAVHFARGGAARPWWTFTPERKGRDQRGRAGPAGGAP